MASVDFETPGSVRACAFTELDGGLDPDDDDEGITDGETGDSASLFAEDRYLEPTTPAAATGACRGSEYNPTLSAVVGGNDFHSTSRNAIRRDLQEYKKHMGAQFTERVRNAKAEEHWLDLGAGDMIASRQLAGLDVVSFPAARTVAPAHPPRVSAVSYAIEDDTIESSACFTPYVGHFFEAIPNDALTSQFGTVDVVSDFWGVLAYTDRPTKVLNKLYDIMSDGGQLFVRVGPKSFAARRSGMSGRIKPPKSSMFASTVTGTEGEMTMPEWMMTQVRGFTADLDIESGTMVLTKDASTPFCAPVLKLDQEPDTEHMPPARHFAEEES